MKSLKISLYGTLALVCMVLVTPGAKGSEEAPDVSEAEQIENSKIQPNFARRGWEMAKRNRGSVGFLTGAGMGLVVRNSLQNPQKRFLTVSKMYELAFHLLNGYAFDYARWDSKNTNDKNVYRTDELNNALKLTEDALSPQRNTSYNHKTINNAILTIQEISNQMYYDNVALKSAVSAAIDCLDQINNFRKQ